MTVGLHKHWTLVILISNMLSLKLEGVFLHPAKSILCLFSANQSWGIPQKAPHKSTFQRSGGVLQNSYMYLHDQLLTAAHTRLAHFFSFYITSINEHGITDLSVCLWVISHCLHMMLISISKRSFSAEKFCLFVTLGQRKGEKVMKVLQDCYCCQ